jgi:hypothetical protein
MALCSALREGGFIVSEGCAYIEQVHVNTVCREVIEGLDGELTRTFWGDI